MFNGSLSRSATTAPLNQCNSLSHSTAASRNSLMIERSATIERLATTALDQCNNLLQQQPLATSDSSLTIALHGGWGGVAMQATSNKRHRGSESEFPLIFGGTSRTSYLSQLADGRSSVHHCQQGGMKQCTVSVVPASNKCNKRHCQATSERHCQ
jgi:hypothetical protein